MRKLNYREIQLCELEILKVFHDFCEKNDLKYMLSSGTLLGAIRHKGFIPWDDDIDLDLSRPDYERLLRDEGMDYSDLPKHIKICRWTDGTLNYPFIKFVDTRTKIDSQYIENDKDIAMVWIDVFPLDGMSDDEKESMKTFHKISFWKLILATKMAKVGTGKKWWKRILKPVCKMFLLPFTLQGVCKRIDDLSKQYSYDECNYIRHYAWGNIATQRINREKYENIIKVEFENELFNAPFNYDEYLKVTYGNYMEMPPEEKRITHDMIVWMEEI